MSLTIFGVVVIALGLFFLLRGTMVQMLAFVMCVTLLGGSAAIALPSLGGSTIPPANLALVFLLARAILPGPGQEMGLLEALGENIFLLIFGLYGALSAWFLPRLFQGATQVTPLRPGAVRQLYENVPVVFSSQNITTSVYLLGTVGAGIGAFIGASRPGSARLLSAVGIGIALTHAMLGFLSVAVANTPFNAVIEFFRNGHYAQLDQSIAGLARMSGIWPEASGFAAFGGTWMIFMTELWLRNVRPLASGMAALLLAVALLISTSSTAYVALAGYSVMLTLRAMLIPTSIGGRKLLILAVLIGAGLIIIIALVLAFPPIPKAFERVLRIMTVDKTESWSGRQRLFWALQGLDAFTASWGLGIGAGSFRSSSLITAIIGSMGVVGIVAFAGHLLRAFRPLEAATWDGRSDDMTRSVGIAASWTAALMLMPAAISSPTPDPGITWALFAGLALGLRSPARERHRRPDTGYRSPGLAMLQEARP